MRLTAAVLSVMLILAACVGPAPATTPSPSAAPAGTRALPPEATATVSPTAAPTLPPTPALPADPVDAQTAALRQAFQSDVQVLAESTFYAIEARVELDPVEQVAVIEGVARIHYPNRGGTPIAELPVMLWPNHEQYRSGMQVGAALIDGRQVQPRAALDGLAAVYELPAALTPGEAVDLSIPFRVDASGPIGASSPHRFGITEGVLFAPTFYPLVPRRVGGEWELQDAPLGGDTTNSEVAGYFVRLDIPAEYRPVASGVEVARSERGGRVEVDYVGGPIRDFAFALGPFELEERGAQGVAVRGWFLPDHAEDAGRMLDAAAFQLELLGERVGPYPYTELDLVDVPGAFGGIEYPGLVTIGTMGTPWLIEPVVHEVAHQWFYGLIGDDQVKEPWMDEAFATYATALYWEFADGPGRATGYLTDLRAVVRDHPQTERPIGLGVGEYQGRDYSVFVYLKGALFYQELRQQLGDELFFDFLRRFYQEHRYGFASASDFHTSAEATCSCELDSLFDTWVYQGGDW